MIGVAHDLEGVPVVSSAALYRAREEDVEDVRPLFTGDVFAKVDVVRLGEEKRKNLIVLQHPCAMRKNGTDLVPLLLMAEVRQHKLLEEGQWGGHGKLMPLPELLPSVTSGRRNQAALFDELYLVEPEKLRGRRVAVLSQFGVNLLLQRWVHHNSRVVVPTATFFEQTSGVYEESDLIEEWCDDRTAAGTAIDDAAKECVEWLRESTPDGVMRQQLLVNPQSRSAVRKEMRSHLKDLRVG